VACVPAGVAEIPQIAELEKVCFSDPWSEEVLKASVGHPLYRFLAAKDGDRVLGYVGMLLTLPEAQIANLAVSPQARRRGIGRRLLRRMCEEASSAGAEVMYLEVREHNEAAISLYEQEGFARLGVRRNYYANPTEHGFVYGKSIPRPTEG